MSSNKVSLAHNEKIVIKSEEYPFQYINDFASFSSKNVNGHFDYENLKDCEYKIFKIRDDLSSAANYVCTGNLNFNDGTSEKFFRSLKDHDVDFLVSQNNYEVERIGLAEKLNFINDFNKDEVFHMGAYSRRFEGLINYEVHHGAMYEQIFLCVKEPNLFVDFSGKYNDVLDIGNETLFEAVQKVNPSLSMEIEKNFQDKGIQIDTNSNKNNEEEYYYNLENYYFNGVLKEKLIQFESEKSIFESDIKEDVINYKYEIYELDDKHFSVSFWKKIDGNDELHRIICDEKDVLKLMSKEKTDLEVCDITLGEKFNKMIDEFNCLHTNKQYLDNMCKYHIEHTNWENLINNGSVDVILNRPFFEEERKADILNCIDTNGFSCLDVAMNNGKLELSDELMKTGALNKEEIEIQKEQEKNKENVNDNGNLELGD